MKKRGVKRKGILCLILACIATELFSVKIQAGVEPGNLYALSAVLLDGSSGRVLYEKNGYEERPMASTTKIMTCIVVLEQGNLEEEAETSAYAASMPKVRLGAFEGERFRVRDLLYSLMLESHNDSAVILAEHVGGSVQGFARRLNEKAAQIGCKDTWFITPNGLDAEESWGEEKKIHATTAADLARIMRYCILQSPKREEFLEITRTPSYEFSDTEGKRNFICGNHNAFLQMMEGALSGKTGFTAKAGYCYVGALEREGKTLIVALLGCGWPNNKGYKWSDTKKLMEYGLSQYSLHWFSEAEPVGTPEELPVRQGQSRDIGEEASVPLKRIAEEDGSILLGPGEKITAFYQGEESLQAPVKEGQKVGELVYTVGEEVWKREDLVAAREVKAIDFSWCLEQTMKRLTALGGEFEDSEKSGT